MKDQQQFRPEVEPTLAADLPSVTVLVPVYNLERYLPDTVASLSSQDYSGPLKFILLDDGSTDHSLEVAKRLTEHDSRFTVRHQSNKGRVGARNALLQLADTELIAWLDGDDMAAPSWLSDQVRFLMQQPECVAVSAQGYAMTAAGYPIGPIRHPLSAEEIDQSHINGLASVFFQSCVTVRRSAVLKAGGYDSRFSCAEDYSLWLRLAEHGTLRNLNVVHLHYRVHAASANWTVNIEQRNQGQAILNEARRRRGLSPMESPDTQIAPAKTDDWNRRVFWINIALRSGNPLTALRMATVALRHHPLSLVLWLMTFTAMLDAGTFFGNRTPRFVPGSSLHEGELPTLSWYRLGRWLVRLRRRWINSRSSSRAAQHDVAAE